MESECPVSGDSWRTFVLSTRVAASERLRQLRRQPSAVPLGLGRFVRGSRLSGGHTVRAQHSCLRLACMRVQDPSASPCRLPRPRDCYRRGLPSRADAHIRCNHLDRTTCAPHCRRGCCSAGATLREHAASHPSCFRPVYFSRHCWRQCGLCTRSSATTKRARSGSRTSTGSSGRASARCGDKPTLTQRAPARRPSTHSHMPSAAARQCSPRRPYPRAAVPDAAFPCFRCLDGDATIFTYVR